MARVADVRVINSIGVRVTRVNLDIGVGVTGVTVTLKPSDSSLSSCPDPNHFIDPVP